MEQQNLADQYNYSQWWRHSSNQHMAELMPEVFACPSTPNGGETMASAGPLFTGFQTSDYACPTESLLDTVPKAGRPTPIRLLARSPSMASRRSKRLFE
ncbi:hypothetical protein Enr8_06900 [Blastopirellula retiformator]|uniref:DUF1559 domain-containing protein n=2 Tax=Blastopirellula retiformator TaxID=2527970 RepID=A0A5C5VM94_9BACT|nr:hypothetical protein Enr8_06900 [Blastopirellula retiformator]